MEYLIGAGLALLVGLGATYIGFDRDRAFYPTVMCVIAVLYTLFAVMGGSSHALAAESLPMLAFLAAAIAGFKRSLWLVVLALAGAWRLRSHAPAVDRQSGCARVLAGLLRLLRCRGGGVSGVAAFALEDPGHGALKAAQSHVAVRLRVPRATREASGSGNLGPGCILG